MPLGSRSGKISSRYFAIAAENNKCGGLPVYDWVLVGGFSLIRPLKKHVPLIFISNMS